MKAGSAEACRFFTVDQAVAWAVAAYYGASRSVEPPKGEPWVVEGVPFASAEDFEVGFLDRLAARMNRAAIEAGLDRIEPEHFVFLLSDFSGEKVNSLPEGPKAGNNLESGGICGI
jgi:hypothetical protein